jgi:RNA polymerase sporulation-specific sigma factor
MQIKNLYEKLQNTLRGREKIVIEQRYGIGSVEKTQREIAEDLDISRSYVSRIEKKALKKLLKAMLE